MNFTYGLFSSGIEWISCGVALLVCLYAILRAPWHTVLENSHIQHRLLGSILVLVCLWQLNVTLNGGVSLHFLGMSTITLLFGWHLALLAGLVVLLLDAIWNSQLGLVLGVNALFNVVIPVVVTWWIHLRIERLKLSNPFIFILGTGFFGCVLSTTFMALSVLAAVIVLSDIDLVLGIGDYLGYLPIFVFPEAVVNGMFISTITVLHPHVMTTFDEARYFKQTETEMILDEYIESPLVQ